MSPPPHLPNNNSNDYYDRPYRSTTNKRRKMLQKQHYNRYKQTKHYSIKSRWFSYNCNYPPPLQQQQQQHRQRQQQQIAPPQPPTHRRKPINKYQECSGSMNLAVARPTSPFLGTEEHTLRKIQQASDMIKQQLLMNPPLAAEEQIIDNDNNIEERQQESPASDKANKTSDATTTTAEQAPDLVTGGGATHRIIPSVVAAPAPSYDAKELHNKIIDHICHLNHKKKVDFITSSASPSTLKLAIQQIQRQKRLELSKALRKLCSEQILESNDNDLINSIIPDIGIKLEDLPWEVFDQLRKTLDLDPDEVYPTCGNNDGMIDDIVNRDPAGSEEGLKKIVEIKQEEVEDDGIKNEAVEDEELIVVKQEIDDTLTNQEETAATTSNHYHSDYLIDNTLQASTVVVLPPPPPQSSSITKLLEPVKESHHHHRLLPSIDFNDNSTQTDPLIATIEPQSLVDAIQSMVAIDEEILRLTRLRQNIFLNLQRYQSVQENRFGEKLNEPPLVEGLEAATTTTTLVTTVCRSRTSSSSVMKKPDDVVRKEDRFHFEHELDLDGICEKILVIKVVDCTLLATSQTGKLFTINLSTNAVVDDCGGGTRSFSVHQITDTPITALSIWTTPEGCRQIFVGALEAHVKVLDFESKTLIKMVDIYDRNVQCMEVAWDCIFIGCIDGFLLRYAPKRHKIEFEETISGGSILVLKATQEGGRKVLLVGSRNSPVCIRDAMSGLHMRTMDGLISPTVYSLLLDNSLVYCGTTFHDILVFKFHDGSLFHKHQAATSKGIGCMKVVNNLLFASCHNGQIYVYSTKSHRYIDSIKGPGGAIAAMEVIGNLVIVGTLSFMFKSIIIPDHILTYEY